MYLTKNDMNGGFCERQGSDFLVAKILGSSIASGLVTSVDSTKAEALPGVIKVFTCLGAPENLYFSGDDAFNIRHTADRMLLDRRVRFCGEPIAVVVANDDLTAQKALSLIKVAYSEYDIVTNPGDTVDKEIQDSAVNNRQGHFDFSIGEATQEAEKNYSSEFNVNVTRFSENTGCYC